MKKLGLIVFIGLLLVIFKKDKPERETKLFVVPFAHQIKTGDRFKSEEPKETAVNTQNKPNDEIAAIQVQLKSFQKLNYDEMSPAQLNRFNELNLKKAQLIKKMIIEKFGKTYATSYNL